MFAASFFGWALLVVLAEKTITLNNLSPATNLAAPGQLIPLITGLAVAIDGLLFMCRPSEGSEFEQFAEFLYKYVVIPAHRVELANSREIKIHNNEGARKTI